MNLETCKVETSVEDLNSYDYDCQIVSMLILNECVEPANKKGGKVVDL